jgi:hypothetical protein
MLIMNRTSLEIDHKTIPVKMISEIVNYFQFMDVNIDKVDIYDDIYFTECLISRFAQTTRFIKNEHTTNDNEFTVWLWYHRSILNFIDVGSNAHKIKYW